MKKFKGKKKPKSRLKSSIAENAGVSVEELMEKLKSENANQSGS